MTDPFFSLEGNFCAVLTAPTDPGPPSPPPGRRSQPAGSSRFPGLHGEAVVG